MESDTTMESDTEDEPNTILPHIPCKNWSYAQNNLVSHFLLLNSTQGCFEKKNLTSTAAIKFGMLIRTVESIWSGGKKI